ncbi:MAG: PAS domain S-box protein [Kofleriaceae bacterium]|nr:PAS domain S-box protein [Kofleriaceae bacterium]MBP6840312.1 PAS domain S-box protein [Kofleriaceae bacterium]
MSSTTVLGGDGGGPAPTGGDERDRLIDALRTKLARSQQRTAELERLIEDRSREVFTVNELLREGALFLADVVRTFPDALLIVDERARVISANPAAATLFAVPEHELTGRGLDELLIEPSLFDHDWLAQGTAGGEQVLHTECLGRTSSGAPVPCWLAANRLMTDRKVRYVCAFTDLRERKRLEIELRHAQKLESIGRLAAGVAHEINTPVQFASDSVHFVRDVIGEVLAVLAAGGEVLTQIEATSPGGPAGRVLAAAAEADVPYLAAAIPKALARALEGMDRVAAIVRSLKAFAHPGTGVAAPADLNQAITSTLQVARNEYRYVADVETSLAELPPVTCWIGEVNQAVLNLVINAAHAIADVVAGTERRGTIAVATRADGDHVVIEVRDSGGGIPAHLHERIFEPFFTTKPVGQGTGQGLAIVRAVVVERHHGTVDFTSTLGQGTTFRLRLPLHGAVGRATRSAA